MGSSWHKIASWSFWGVLPIPKLVRHHHWLRWAWCTRRSPDGWSFRYSTQWPQQFLDWESPVDFHDARTQVIVWSMKGYCQVDLNPFIGKVTNLMSQARRWNGNMTGTDSQPLVIINRTDKSLRHSCSCQTAHQFPSQRYGWHVHLVHVRQSIFEPT